MPRFADEKLRKITLHLYDRDVELLQKAYPGGYQEAIRLIVRKECAQRREQEVGDDHEERDN